MVAEALRDNRVRTEMEETNTEGTNSNSSSGNTTVGDLGKTNSETGQWEYAAMTLPCIAFPSRTTPGTSHHPNPLFMTMALMYDEDPRRRCFHCILTDQPGTNGDMGFITAELLSLLFATEKRQDPSSVRRQEPSTVSADTSSSESNNRTSDSYSLDLAETVASED